MLDLMTTMRAGFPYPAEDLEAKRIDLTAKLIKHPQATFFMKARGESMREAGIFDGDVLIVDRAIQARSGHVVIAVIEGEFVCKPQAMRAGSMKLQSPATLTSCPNLVSWSRFGSRDGIRRKSSKSVRRNRRERSNDDRRQRKVHRVLHGRRLLGG